MNHHEFAIMADCILARAVASFMIMGLPDLESRLDAIEEEIRKDAKDMLAGGARKSTIMCALSAKIVGRLREVK